MTLGHRHPSVQSTVPLTSLNPKGQQGQMM